MLATMFSGGVYAVESCKESRYAASQREQARLDGEITYSVNGKDYLTATGEQVFVWNGQIKSLKTGKIIYDINKENVRKHNNKYLEETKTEGAKYISSYKIYNPENQKYESYTVELSTMKPYELVYKSISKGDEFEWIYYKKYLKDNGWMEDLVRINEKEFKELGGYIPYNLTPEEHFYLKFDKYKRERKKALKKL